MRFVPGYENEIFRQDLSSSRNTWMSHRNTCASPRNTRRGRENIWMDYRHPPDSLSQQRAVESNKLWRLPQAVAQAKE